MNNTDIKNKISITTLSIAILLVMAYICFIVYKNTPVQRLKKQISLGDKYLAELNFDDAIIAYSMAIGIDPKSSDAYAGLTKAYIGLQDYDMAYAVAEKGIESVGIKEALLTLLSEVERKQRAVSDKTENDNTTGILNSESIDNPLEIYAGASREGNWSEDEPDDAHLEENTKKELETDVEEYDKPPVLADLSEKDGKYYIGNDQLWLVYSYGSIKDRGDYYELADVVLSFYDNSNTDPDADFPQTDEGFAPATFRVRKDAIVWLPTPNEKTSAEEYYATNRSFAPEEDRRFGYGDVFYSTGENFKVDDNGYIIEFSAFPFE